jgi:hypothetical protein
MLEFNLFLRRLLPEQWPEPRFGAQLGMLLALVMAGVGILLGIYLLGVG